MDSKKSGTISEDDKTWMSTNDVGNWYREWNSSTLKLHNMQMARLQSAILLKSNALSTLVGTGWEDDAGKEEMGKVGLSRVIATHTPRIRNFERDEAMKEIREGGSD